VWARAGHTHSRAGDSVVAHNQACLGSKPKQHQVVIVAIGQLNSQGIRGVTSNHAEETTVSSRHWGVGSGGRKGDKAGA
jgi:hypothetical protein